MLAIAPGWKLDVDRGPGWLLVTVGHPEPSATETPPLADQLWTLLERHFVYRLVIDLHNVDLLHSYLLGQLVVLHKRIRDRGGMMRLCRLTPFNQEVLQVHGLDDRFPAYSDLADAVMGSSPRKPR